jgi:signal transduction histidine kinase
VLNIGGLLLVIGITQFAYAFPRPSRYPVPSAVLWTPLFVGGAVLVIRSQIITGMQFSSGSVYLTHGNDAAVWAMLLLTYACLCTERFRRSFVEADRDTRSRFLLMYLGAAFFSVSVLVFYALLPVLLSFGTLKFMGPLSALAFVSATAYAVLAEEFLDMLVVQQSAFYTASLFSLACLYAVLLTFLDYLFVGMTHLAFPVAVAATIVIGMYSLPRIERYFMKLTYPFFFRGEPAPLAPMREGVPEDLFSDISHAIQTPLTVLLSGVESFRDTTSSLHRNARVMEQAATDISHLTNSMLRFSRIDAPLEEGRNEAVDLQDLVRSVCEYVGVIAEPKGIALRCEASDPCSVFGSRKQLEEALGNILSNSVKYTAGCQRMEISVRLVPGDAFHRITVEDTGIGIPEDDLELVFNRFHRAAGDGSRGGYGLGLPIAKRIIEQHGGQVSLTSAVGRGTIVTLSLPKGRQDS